MDRHHRLQGSRPDPSRAHALIQYLVHTYTDDRMSDLVAENFPLRRWQEGPQRHSPLDERVTRTVPGGWNTQPNGRVTSIGGFVVADGPTSYNQNLWMHHLTGGATYLPL
jgi:hypothetical protein